MEPRLDVTLEFLKALAANNNLDWFHAHRADYDRARAAFELLVEELILKFNRYEDLGGVQPRDCMFRINRDVRFSPDKSPYKINMSAVISRGGRKSPRGAYYLHFQPGASFIAGGIYIPDAERLLKIRRAIDADAAALRRILKNAAFKKTFGGLDDEEMLKTAPKGFAPDHPALDLLRQKHFTATVSLTDQEIVAPGFSKRVVQTFRALQPLNDWLNAALGV
ncbi:MAG: DUF2461 domain-containing protein [Chloroflexi bacterium]|nr:DUF2461 domain-containing protein [Chloroflexota bacterium]